MLGCGRICIFSFCAEAQRLFNNKIELVDVN